MEALAPPSSDLAQAKPGDLFEVSEPSGNGFASLFHAERNLQAAIEEGRSLLLIASSVGIGPMRAAIDWPPVLAGAASGHNPVTLLYHCGDSLESAVGVEDWDDWRASNVHVIPCFGTLEPKEADAGAGGPRTVIEDALFRGETGIAARMRGSPAVLVAGLPGPIAARVVRNFAEVNCLFCDL